MGKFIYKLVSKQNKVIGGSIAASSKKKAIKELKKDGSTVLFVIADKNALSFGKKLILLSSFSMMSKINFFRNLSAMLAAGVSIADTLRTFKEQEHSKKTKKVFTAMIQDVENGDRFSEAMKKHPKYFSEFLVETVNVGEVTGRLVATLDRISEDLRYQYDLKRTVMASMAYPAIVVCTMLVVLVGLMVYVLPQIASLFQELNVRMPLPTLVLFSISMFIQTYPFVVIGGIFGFILLFFILFRMKKGHYIFNYISIKLPIFGTLIKETNLALLFRTLEALFASGVSLMRSIDIARKTVKNDVYKRALDTLNPILIHGVKLSETLKPFPSLFPIQLQRMVEVGERSGKLEESFKNLNLYYDRSVRHRTQVLATTIEPLILIVVGIGIAIIALSIFLPIYDSVQIL